MKPIFNSLGSNYTPELVQLAGQGYWSPTKNDDQALESLQRALTGYLPSTAVLVYKGRDAIQLAVQAIIDLKKPDLSGRQMGIITQGLACHAIEEGILRAGMVPVYVDLEPNTLGPSPKTIEEGLKWAKAHDVEVQGVLLQHTLGYANPVLDIRRFCDRYDLVLIEDLAQCFGAEDEQGKPLGQLADLIICSFGRDKVLDAVSGGALLLREGAMKKSFDELTHWAQLHQPTSYPPISAVRKEMFYPRLTQIVQQTHQVGFGKVLFQAAKKLKLLTSPIASPTHQPTTLPAAYARLVVKQFEQLTNQLSHRRMIAGIYYGHFQTTPQVQCLIPGESLEHDVHLRVPLLFQTHQDLKAAIQALKKHNIHLSDRWYRAVVDSGSLNYRTVYQLGTCPTAESTAERILNLPTHHHITAADAEKIATIIINATKK